MMNIKFFVATAMLSAIALGAIAQVSSSSQSSSSGSASASAQAGGVSRASGSSFGSGGNTGTLNGEKVFVAEFITKSSNASGTDEFRSKVAEHELYVKNLSTKYNFVLAGQYVEDGQRMMAFSAKDATIAKNVVDGSPLTRSGFCTAKVRELLVSTAKLGGSTSRHAAEAMPDSIASEPTSP